MTTTKQDGTIVTEVENADDEEVSTPIANIEKDDDNGVWIASCNRCDRGFANEKKAATVDAVEEHFQLAHVTP